MIPIHKSMIEYPRDKITLVFSLYLIESNLYQDNPLLLQLAVHNYPIPDFLSDLTCLTLDEDMLVCFLQDHYKERMYTFINRIDDNYKEAIITKIVHYQKFLYSFMHNRLPEIRGYCDYKLDYYLNASLFYLIIY